MSCVTIMALCPSISGFQYSSMSTRQTILVIVFTVVFALQADDNSTLSPRCVLSHDDVAQYSDLFQFSITPINLQALRTHALDGHAADGRLIYSQSMRWSEFTAFVLLGALAAVVIFIVAYGHIMP
jgi:hypothetical protein